MVILWQNRYGSGVLVLIKNKIPKIVVVLQVGNLGREQSEAQDWNANEAWVFVYRLRTGKCF